MSSENKEVKKVPVVTVKKYKADPRKKIDWYELAGHRNRKLIKKFSPVVFEGENIIPTLLFKNLPDTYSSNELYNLCNGFGPIETYKYEPLCNIGSITYNLANKNGKIPRNALLSLTGSLVKNKYIKVEFDRDELKYKEISEKKKKEIQEIQKQKEIEEKKKIEERKKIEEENKLKNEKPSSQENNKNEKSASSSKDNKYDYNSKRKNSYKHSYEQIDNGKYNSKNDRDGYDKHYYKNERRRDTSLSGKDRMDKLHAADRLKQIEIEKAKLQKMINEKEALMKKGERNETNVNRKDSITSSKSYDKYNENNVINKEKISNKAKDMIVEQSNDSNMDIDDSFTKEDLIDYTQTILIDELRKAFIKDLKIRVVGQIIHNYLTPEYTKPISQISKFHNDTKYSSNNNSTVNNEKSKDKVENKNIINDSDKPKESLEGEDEMKKSNSITNNIITGGGMMSFLNNIKIKKKKLPSFKKHIVYDSKSSSQERYSREKRSTRRTSRVKRSTKKHNIDFTDSSEEEDNNVEKADNVSISSLGSNSDQDRTNDKMESIDSNISEDNQDDSDSSYDEIIRGRTKMRRERREKMKKQKSKSKAKNYSSSRSRSNSVSYSPVRAKSKVYPKEDDREANFDDAELTDTNEEMNNKMEIDSDESEEEVHLGTTYKRENIDYTSSSSFDSDGDATMSKSKSSKKKESKRKLKDTSEKKRGSRSNLKRKNMEQDMNEESIDDMNVEDSTQSKSKKKKRAKKKRSDIYDDEDDILSQQEKAFEMKHEFLYESKSSVNDLRKNIYEKKMSRRSRQNSVSNFKDEGILNLYLNIFFFSLFIFN